MGASQRSRKNPLQAHGISPGLRLQLELTVGNRTELYSTQVEHVDADRVGVLVPMEGLRRRPLPMGAIVRAFFAHNNRRRRFLAEVDGHSQDGLVDFLHVPGEIEDNDRRGSFRLETSLVPSALFRLVVDAGTTEGERPITIDGSIIDISEGGLCFTTRSTVVRGERLGVQIELAPAGTLTARMRVTSIELPSAERLNRRVHCAFTNLTRHDRDLVARFVMKRQLELRRRGQL